MSEPALWVAVVSAALLTGSLLGFLVAQVRAGHRIEQLRVDLEATRVRLESETRLEAERVALLEESEERLRMTFDSIAGQTLRDNSEMFLRMARETLGRDQGVAQASLKERETAIAQLVEPLRTALEKTDAQVQALERERRDAFSSLRTQIEILTANLYCSARRATSLQL
jgi:DNA recombination protein RmuC